ncbi:DUF4296 domain-containing protein [Pedobacter hiemivivus]|uniref:DUF4296 domain-containing protein n=1 Tax=Pedobacter hiemivivus TaxID=2530454 RepID=A0A4R0MVE0_9SPHI|nr:DUF4296 domain-containing protein [Pedobacter hiemivivus]TCC91128.1 DUF4296 domain-containing protein [Pedobacter hiemivivus]
MRNFLYIVIVFFSISGCKPGVPKDIIQPDEMAKVLHDIHIADSYIGQVARPDSVKIIAAGYYKGIYKKYDIDSALYNKSMNYYYKEPKVLNDIYVKVTGQLTKEKDAIVKADSIFNANEIQKARLKMVRDSTRTADSTFWADFLLKDRTKLKKKLTDTAKLSDSAKLKDTVKKSIDVIRLKMDYKGLKDLK